MAAPHTEAAIWRGDVLSATGTGILFAGLIGGFLMGYRRKELVKT